MEFFEGEILEGDKPRKGSIKLGIAVGLVITIIFELIIGLALNVQTNLVHRYIAYMLGLIPIIVAAVLSRSIFKMVFVGAPVLIISSFALPYFFPDIFSGLMTPFLTLLPVINEAAEIITRFGLDETGELQSVLVLVNQYGFVLDFVLAMLVAMFVGIGIAPIAKIIFGKPNVLTFILTIFGIVFLVLGLVVLPYVFVVASGTAQFSMSLGVGGALMGEGFEEASKQDGNLTLANVLFGEAEEWFNESEILLEGLKSLGVFRLVSSANPQLAIIVENGLLLVEAGVDLAQGISPALAGLAAITKGMEQAITALENGSQTVLTLSQVDEEQFSNGIDLIEQGLDNFTDASSEIKEAITTIDQMDQDELNQALINQGLGDQSSSINLLLDGIRMLNVTLDIFTNESGTGLMDDPEGDDRAPIIHLMFGVKALNEVQQLIGENTSFEGTGPKFKDVISNLTRTLNSLDEANNPGIRRLDELNVENSQQVLELKNQVSSTIAFLRDAANVTISIGRFGVIASPTLTSMNSTMSFLTGSTDFTELTTEEYDNAIEAFDGNDTLNFGITQNATRMRLHAANVRNQINSMEENVNSEVYGFLGDPAQEFVNEFRAFNLTRNADNLFYISKGFSALLKSAKSLANVDVLIDHITNSTNIIQKEIDDNGLSADVDKINAQADFIDANITQSNTVLQWAKANITNASNNFNKTVNMPQLAKTSAAFASIAVHIDNIQFGDGTNQGLDGIETSVANIRGNATLPFSQTKLDNIVDNLSNISDELDFIGLEFDGIQADLTDVSIAA